MSESELHNHPENNLFYCQLVVKYAKLCGIAYTDIFLHGKRTDKDRTAPNKAFIMFGKISKTDSIVGGFDLPENHTFSLSCSVPRFKGTDVRNYISRQRLDALRANIPGIHDAINAGPADLLTSEEWPAGNCAEIPAIGW